MIKVAIYSGVVPSTTFIERLIAGIANGNQQVFLFGYTNKKISYSQNNIILSTYSGRVNKVLRVIWFGLLLFVFNKSDKKHLDRLIKLQKFNSLILKVKYYPVLWYRPDVFHIQWAKSIEDWFWVKNFGIKLVVGLRGSQINCSPTVEPLINDLYKRYFPQVDGFHAVSNAIAKEAKKYGAHPDKIKVIYSGLPKLIVSHERENVAFSETKKIQLLSIGRSHWIKGYDYALDTCKLLKEQGIDFHYTIVGVKGAEELEYQKNDLGLNSEVTFLDKLPYEKVLQLMREAHLIVLPSVEEGIANVILEAMLLQKLVLTTNCGGMEEIVKDGENGFVVPIRNPEAMSKKIIEISCLSKEQIHTITTNARKTIERVNSEEKMVADMETLYHFVLEKTITS